MKYYCSKCKLSVIVLPETEPIKACKCTEPIVGEMEAVVYSHSRLAQDKPKK